MSPFAGQVAVVTGASSGIGEALARELACAGARVGVIARRADRLAELATSLKQSGSQVAVAAADVADRAGLTAAIRAVETELGPTDLMVANAGVARTTPVDPFTADDVELMMRVNYLGVVYAVEAVLPAMVAQRRGHIAAVSSLAAFKGLPLQPGYCASKAAVNTFFDGMRVALRPHGVTMTTICPGYVRSEMTADISYPMPLLMDADAAARLIVRALARRRKVFSFPWRMRQLMRLAALAPDALLDRVTRNHRQKQRKDRGPS